MRRGRAKFAMFVLSAAVLAGAWVVAESMAEGSVPETGEEEPQPEYTDLSVGGYRELTALSWSWAGETVNLEREAESGRWVSGDDESCPIDTEAAEELAKAAVSIRASMAIPGVTDFAQYGLDEPVLTVIAATEDTAMTYQVGNKSITGEYYLRLEGDDTVYLENGALSAFRVSVRDILDLEEMPEDMSAVTGLSVRSGAENYDLEYRDGEEPGWFRTDGEEPQILEGDRVKALYGTLTGASFDRCVTWTAEDPAAYGLEEPQASAEIRYRDAAGRERSVTVEFGAYEGEDVYARFAGSGLVYLLPGAVPDALMYPRWETMTPMTVMNLDLESIARIRISLHGGEYEIQRLEETVDRAAGDRTVSVTEAIYSLNGWVLDTGRTEAWLTELAGLPAEGLAPAGEGRDTMLSVTISWKDEEAVPAELELRRYDSVHDLCVLGGDRFMLVPRDAAGTAAADAASLLAEAGGQGR